MVSKWFKNILSDQPGPLPEAEHSLEKVRALLDEIGQARLKVAAPKLKVLLSLIAQNGESYLVRTSADGKPPEHEIAQFQEHLRAALRVLEQYVSIQNDQQYPNRQAKMLEGFEAIDGFAASVLKATAPGGTASNTNFTVDTKILSAQRYTTT